MSLGLKRLIQGFILGLSLPVIACLTWYYWPKSEPQKTQEVAWTKENSLVKSEITKFSDKRSLASFKEALEYSIEYYTKQKPDREYNFGGKIISAEQQLTSLKVLLKSLEQKEFSWQQISQSFDIYKSAAESVLFTGYYEPELKGSLTKSDKYRYPLYRKPADLAVINLPSFPTISSALTSSMPTQLRARVYDQIKIEPYWDRNEIDNLGKLNQQDLELLWVDDLVDLFFLQIQGSGKIALEDGKIIRVGYAEKNGQPYRPIGKLLLEQGKLLPGKVSMQTIKTYLRQNPQEMTEIFNYNPSYVFFRELEGAALGSIGQPVTGFRTIATDSALFPHGALAYIDLMLPEFDEAGNKIGESQESFFVFNQDTGGAIKKPSRVDLFTGAGKQAELVAGHLSARGSLFFLAPK